MDRDAGVAVTVAVVVVEEEKEDQEDENSMASDHDMGTDVTTNITHDTSSVAYTLARSTHTHTHMI